MKSICSTALLFLLLTPAAFTKSRLGEYYYGFGYSMLDGGKGGVDVEGDVLHLRPIPSLVTMQILNFI